MHSATYQKFDKQRQELVEEWKDRLFVCAEQCMHDVRYFAQDVYVIVILRQSTSVRLALKYIATIALSSIKKT